MTSTVSQKQDVTMPAMAGLERREAERSEADRSARPAIAPPNPEVRAKAQRRTYSAAEKLSVVERADAAKAEGGVGALLRKEGVDTSQLADWRRQRDAGAQSALGQKRGRKPVRDSRDEEISKLRVQVDRLEQKLEQASLIIEVQKQVATLLGISLPATKGCGEAAPFSNWFRNPVAWPPAQRWPCPAPRSLVGAGAR